MKKLKEISYVQPPQKVFRDIDHYRKVRTAILSALSKSKIKRTSGNESYLINRLIVRFTKTVEAEEIFIDYLNGQVVLEAPILKNESSKDLTERRMSYFSSLIRSVEAISTIGITHIYLVLSDSGRKELEKTNVRRGVR